MKKLTKLVKQRIKEEIQKLQEQPQPTGTFYVCGSGPGEYVEINLPYDEWQGGGGAWNSYTTGYCTQQVCETWCDASGNGNTWSPTGGYTELPEMSTGFGMCSTLVGGGYANVISDPYSWNVNPNCPGIGGSPQITPSIIDDFVGNIVWVASAALGSANLQEQACFACNGNLNPDCPNYCPTPHSCSPCDGCVEDPNGAFESLEACQESSSCFSGTVNDYAISIGIPDGVPGVDDTIMSAEDQYCIKCQSGSWPPDMAIKCECCSTGYTFDNNTVTYDPDWEGMAIGGTADYEAAQGMILPPNTGPSPFKKYQNPQVKRMQKLANIRPRFKK
jgi:hypothetical protein